MTFSAVAATFDLGFLSSSFGRYCSWKPTSLPMSDTQTSHAQRPERLLASPSRDCVL